MTPTWQSALVNVSAFVAGVLTCRLLFHSRRNRMADSPQKSWRRAGVAWFVAALVIILFGVQQYQFQQQGKKADNDRDDQATCLSDWGADVVSALSARVDANDDLKAAQTRRDEALDAIIGVVIASRAAKSQAQSRKDFDAALTEFAAAKAELIRTQRTVAHTLRKNPYPPPPTLTCS